MIPIRIQRKRSKGWRMPKNTVYVGRGSKWGNPFVVGHDGNANEVIKKFAAYVFPYNHSPPDNGLKELFISNLMRQEITSELKGKNLACWCPLSSECHADFLLKWANYEHF